MAEIATELINGNLLPFEYDPADFQKYLMRMQLDKEKVYEYVVSFSGDDTVIIL